MSFVKSVTTFENQAMLTQKVNKLLRRYLKFGNGPSFNRLASYASVWEIADDKTHLM